MCTICCCCSCLCYTMLEIVYTHHQLHTHTHRLNDRPEKCPFGVSQPLQQQQHTKLPSVADKICDKIAHKIKPKETIPNIISRARDSRSLLECLLLKLCVYNLCSADGRDCWKRVVVCCTLYPTSRHRCISLSHHVALRLRLCVCCMGKIPAL